MRGRSGIAGWLAAAGLLAAAGAGAEPAPEGDGGDAPASVLRELRELRERIPGELSGFFAVENRFFFHEEQFPDQRHWSGIVSLVADPEWDLEWNDGDDAVLFEPFFRWDPTDARRTHFDLRELNYLHVGVGWELRLGVTKVFWGVVESQHLVDIINQDDAVEDVDGEDKLGQGMIHLSLLRDFGVFEVFVLPGFRERTFPGRKARLRPAVRVDTDKVSYESSLGQGHVDFAGRWSHVLGDWEIALSHFYGTGRDPRFRPGLKGTEPRLFPRYDLIHQTGLEAQYTGASILWKLEAIGRSGPGTYRGAVAGGLEYTFYGIFDTDTDLGVLCEGHYDSADNDQQPFNPFEHDVFGGLRLTLNDEQSTELLAGAIVDVKDGSQFWNIEGSRRLGQSFKLELDVRLFRNFPRGDRGSERFFSSFRRDDFAQLRLSWFF